MTRRLPCNTLALIEERYRALYLQLADLFGAEDAERMVVDIAFRRWP